VKTVSVQEVAGMQAAGYTLLDVRPAEEFEESRAPGAVSVPLFGPIQLDSPSKLLKQLMYSANGMKGTDENVKFVEEVRDNISEPGGFGGVFA
jgi:rhodanese-related sulfurtransferase